MLWAFFFGLTIDVFSDTPGMNAAATVLLAFLRPSLLRLFTPRDNQDNLCGNYNLVPACPPACGTVEEMQAKALKYEKALVLQTVLKDPIMDPLLFKQAKHAQNILTEQLARQMQETGKEDVLIMSAGPYKNCSCMSAYSVDAQKMADAVGMVCWADDSDVRFFTQILFHEDYSKPHK